MDNDTTAQSAPPQFYYIWKSSFKRHWRIKHPGLLTGDLENYVTISNVYNLIKLFIQPVSFVVNTMKFN